MFSVQLPPLPSPEPYTPALRELMKGPTDESAQLVPKRVYMGAYPTTADVPAILAAKVSIFPVCTLGNALHSGTRVIRCRHDFVM